MLRSISLVFAIFTSAALAQVDRATVTGTLLDPSGAAVSDGQITVTFPATGLRREVLTNKSGIFHIPGLPLGHAVVDATHAGFRTVRMETDLGVGETKTFDITLEIASVDSSVEVVAEAELTRDTAALGATFQTEQISQLPINGRNFGNLMALVPGAVDTGGSNIRFLGHGGDDNNLRIDGVDATSIRNQTQKSRLLVSTDAIAEFRVNTAMYTAEEGGAPAGQIEVVSKTGSNVLHGSLFEYLRNSATDARTPFDGAVIPPLRLNQFGATAGGAIKKNRTFFFASYEGLIQRQARTQIGFVPSISARARAVNAVKPIVDVYPIGQLPTSNPDVDQWTGVSSNTQDEHAGLFRLDHRFTDKLTFYSRFSTNRTETFTPSTLLPVGTRNNDAPTSGLLDLTYSISPRSINEVRLGANYAQPLNSLATSPIDIAVAVPNLSSLPAGTRRIAFGVTESLIDQYSTLRGKHTLKAGIEIKRLQLVIHDFANAQAGNLNFNNITDFLNDKASQLLYSGELPTKQMRKTGYFGYVQDEIKLSPTLTANLGVRYEMYGVFSEIHKRDIPFDIQTCGGYCPAGSPFAFNDLNNFAPRVSLAWAPKMLHDRTVIRVGGGIFYGDAQLGDAYSPANNDSSRATLTSATTPGLAYPYLPFINPTASTATAPRSMPRNKRNEVSQQWGLIIQHAITNKISFQVGYNGQQNYHVFNRTYVNVVNPLTGLKPIPSVDANIDVRGEDGVASFQGMVNSFQINSFHGLLVRANYMWSHALNDNSAGGGGSDGSPQNVACRSCDKGNSSLDARHVFNANYAYQVPLGRNHWYGGWAWSGIFTAHTGLPVNVSLTRAANTLPDQNNLSTQRPNLVPGVPLYLDYATTGRWLNPAAFAMPAAGTWGNLGRNVLRAPGGFQIDTALSKRVRLTEQTSLEFGAQIFNIMNHPQLGAPSSNGWSATSSSFGRITAPVNTSPVGSGGPRQMQFFVRLAF
ncbi:MAG TPA: carboxypeptidase regulatory-like domain-containing protein [Bryobacteraceae bacterium]|jgi:hypothetical protein